MRKQFALHLFPLSILLIVFASCSSGSKPEQKLNNKLAASSAVVSGKQEEPQLPKYEFEPRITTDSAGVKNKWNVASIRELYYTSANNPKLDSLSYYDKESKITLFYDANLNLDRIIIDRKTNTKKVHKEFCYTNEGWLYFMFDKEQTIVPSQNSMPESKFAENRFYFYKDWLIKDIMKEYSTVGGKKKVNSIHKKRGDTLVLAEQYNNAYSILNKAKAYIKAKGYTKKFVPTNAVFPNFALVYKDFLVPVADFDYKQKGKPYYKNGHYICDVEEGSIPDNFKALLGQKFALYNQESKTTEVTLEGFHIMASYVPHFGETQREMEEGISEEKLAIRKFNDERANKFLVASFEGSNNSRCYRAGLASLEHNGFVSNLQTEARDLVTELVYKTKEFVAIENEYSEYKNKPEEGDQNIKNTWKEYAHNYFYNASTEKVNIVFYKANSGDGCGAPGFYAGMSTCYYTEKTGDLQHSDFIEIPNSYGIPVLSFDSDNDGFPEFLFINGYETDYTVVEFQDGKFTPMLSLVIPFFDCPC